MEKSLASFRLLKAVSSPLIAANTSPYEISASAPSILELSDDSPVLRFHKTVHKVGRV